MIPAGEILNRLASICGKRRSRLSSVLLLHRCEYFRNRTGTKMSDWYFGWTADEYIVKELPSEFLLNRKGVVDENIFASVDQHSVCQLA